MLYGVVQLIKLINKFFTLTAIISTACLSIHAAPIHPDEKDFTFICIVFWVVQIVMFLATSIASILLTLELFSFKNEFVQNKSWMIFAAIGIAPIFPFAVGWAVFLIWCALMILLKQIML